MKITNLFTKKKVYTIDKSYYISLILHLVKGQLSCEYNIPITTSSASIEEMKEKFRDFFLWYDNARNKQKTYFFTYSNGAVELSRDKIDYVEFVIQEKSDGKNN